MRQNLKVEAKFATLDEAVEWVNAIRPHFIEVLEVSMSNKRRGLTSLLSKDYKPYEVTVSGTAEAK